MIDEFLKNYEVPQGIVIDLHCTGHSLGGAYATLCYSEIMRLYNNNPADPMQGKDMHDHLRAFFSKLKERQFILRDLYTFGCPRLGGMMDNVSWAKNYKASFDHHEGQSWRVVNKGDPVTGVPPVIPFISTWNHVDNGYQIDENSPPQVLPTEIGTKPFGFNPLKFRNHSTALYFKNLFNASNPDATIEVKWIPEFPEDVDVGEVTTENATKED